MDDVCGQSTSDHKSEVRQRIAKHMEWPDLKLGTHRASVKFNLWHFWNPRDGSEREVPARPVPSRILTGA